MVDVFLYFLRFTFKIFFFGDTSDPFHKRFDPLMFIVRIINYIFFITNVLLFYILINALSKLSSCIER